MANKRAKIIVFSCFYDPFISGAEFFVKEVVERLADRYDFTIIAARLDKSLPKYEKRELFEYYRVGLGNSFDKWLYAILAPRLAKKLKPDLAHAVMESYAGIAAWRFKKSNKNIPTVLTLQSGDLDDPSKRRKIPNWLWKKIHTTPDIITAISTALAERAKRLGAKEDRVVIIPNGVDLELAKNSQAEPVTGRIICVARLSWEKALDYLVRAMPEVIAEFPQAHLTLVGEGDKRQEIESLVKELNLGDKIKLLGKLPHDETLKEIGKSEIFICPSLAEGLGIVFIEAQACGVPVIGTRVGGIPDVIQDNETGLLVEPRSSEAISQALKKMLGNEEMRQRLKQNALQNLERFNWDRIAGQVAAEYEKLLS
ncbi:glycosyltransferase family 4 protein [Patescibacteria group bacterium]|nr:glycosyltransferase family 4 protein [Patescibacteria group bacterium]MBU1921718.1 glycosyltransferase family 4 protein [Patescibacteria group bacterium]